MSDDPLPETWHENIASSAAPLRWGMIGTGGFADAVFAPTLRLAGQALLGAAGSSPEGSGAFANRHGCPRSYASPQELLDDREVEAVWVASPNFLHEGHVAAALSQGKHVLAEKPLATTGKAARRLADLAETVDRRLGVGHQARFHPANQELARLVQADELGPVAYLRLSWLTQYAELSRDWRLHWETSGGWALMDIGAHLVDAALWLTGAQEPRLLGARLSTHHFPVENDDLAILLLRMGNTTVVTEAATGVPAPECRIEVYGPKGWTIAINSFVACLGPAGGRLLTSSGLDRSYEDAANPYESEVRAFVDWVRGGHWAGATGEDGAVNVRLLEAARRAGGEERPDATVDGRDLSDAVD